MQYIAYFLDIIINLDKYLSFITNEYGIYVYLLLFMTIFFETGVVIIPFLPGDSLLFAAGTIAAINGLEIKILFVILSVAAIMGDNLNYTIGNFIGKKALEYKYKEKSLVKKEHIEKTQRYFDKYGDKTIIFARFAPIVRTIAPFMAGVGNMNYGRFLKYNILGGIVWTFVFLLGGYLFGNIQIVRDNLSLVILSIIFVSLLPIAKEMFLNKKLP